MVSVHFWVNMHVVGKITAIEDFVVVRFLDADDVEVVAPIGENIPRVFRLPRVNLYHFEHLETFRQP